MSLTLWIRNALIGKLFVDGEYVGLVQDVCKDGHVVVQSLDAMADDLTTGCRVVPPKSLAWVAGRLIRGRSPDGPTLREFIASFGVAQRATPNIAFVPTAPATLAAQGTVATSSREEVPAPSARPRLPLGAGTLYGTARPRPFVPPAAPRRVAP